MLSQMNHFIKYGAREAEPELHLIRNICSTLKLPESCFSYVFGNYELKALFEFTTRTHHND